MKAIPKYVHNWKNICTQTLEIHNLINSLQVDLNSGFFTYR